jgi:hypothetical protein
MSCGIPWTTLARLFLLTIVTRVRQLLDARSHLQTCGQIPRGCSSATSTIETVSFRYATVSLTDGWAERPVEGMVMFGVLYTYEENGRVGMEK